MWYNIYTRGEPITPLSNGEKEITMADKITNRDILTLIANGTSNDTTKEWAKGMLVKMDEKNAKRKNTKSKEQIANEGIMDNIIAYIKANGVTPQKLIEQSNVTHLCTTNEVFDDLSTFEAIAAKDYKFRVIPAFRADKIMNIEAEKYLEFIGKLGTYKRAISSVLFLPVFNVVRGCSFFCHSGVFNVPPNLQ